MLNKTDKEKKTMYNDYQEINHQEISRQITDARRTFTAGIYTAMCDCCDRSETSRRSELISNGWFLGKNENFCPDCNF